MKVVICSTTWTFGDYFAWINLNWMLCLWWVWVSYYAPIPLDYILYDNSLLFLQAKNRTRASAWTPCCDTRGTARNCPPYGATDTASPAATTTPGRGSTRKPYTVSATIRTAVTQLQDFNWTKSLPWWQRWALCYSPRFPATYETCSSASPANVSCPSACDF